jgi:hypothetical protein
MNGYHGRGPSVGEHGATWLKSELDKMSLEQLWLLRNELKQVLTRRMTEEIRELNRRLAGLPSNSSAENFGSQRRPPAKVIAKHRKLDEPT